MFSLHQAGAWGSDDTLKMHQGRITCHAPLKDLIYARERKTVFRTRVIKIRIIYTDSPFSPFLRNHHHVGKPFRVFNFFDKPKFQKIIHLDLDDLVVVRVGRLTLCLTGLADETTFNL